MAIEIDIGLGSIELKQTVGPWWRYSSYGLLLLHMFPNSCIEVSF